MTTLRTGPRPTDPRDLRIRGLTPDDALAGAQLARSHGWSYEPERWRFMLAVGRGWGAVDAAGDLVGTVQLTGCTPDVVAVGSMLVAAPWEGRGVGRTLLERALAADVAAGRLPTLFATRPGRPLYEQVGFRSVGELVMHRGVLRPSAGSHRATLSRPATGADLPAIVALDAGAHGGDRTPLLAELMRFATAVRVLDDDGAPGAVRAFGAAWPGEDQVVVGPLIAVDADAAVAVLDGLAVDVPGPARIDVRAGRPGLDTWLAARRFAPFGRTVAMVLGPRELPGRPERVHAPIMQSLT